MNRNPSYDAAQRRRKSSGFYFSGYCEKFIENWRILEQKWRKVTIIRKIKIGKIWNLVFLFIQPITVLSCKFDHFWRIFFGGILMFLIHDFLLNKINKKILQKLNRKKNQITELSDFYFSSYEEKTQCGRQFWNAVEREPVETRVLNPTASEAS